MRSFLAEEPNTPRDFDDGDDDGRKEDFDEEDDTDNE